jgi:hypothetical protein
MLACHKCRIDLSERAAQQSVCEMEESLLVGHSPISARRKSINAGPLCDPCLARWQAENKDLDTRSPAITRLDEACQQLATIGLTNLEKP